MINGLAEIAEFMEDEELNTALLTLAAINFTHIVDFMIMMPLGPALMRIFAITPQNHAALVSAYTVAAGVTGFFAAFGIDRFDRKKVLLISYFMFTLGFIVTL
jgi:predicted MFS family arabinose efflux permease